MEEGNIHRVFKDSQYLLETVFNAKDGAFVFTRGGFYSTTDKGDEVAFEFNSNFAKDSLKNMTIAKGENWKVVAIPDQDLEGNG